MLYVLWDLGLKVGHASRTVEECLKLSRADITIRTSILEARVILGDESLVEELTRRFRHEVVSGTAPVRRRQARGARRAPRPGRRVALWSSPTSRRARAACATCTPCSGSPSTSTPTASIRRRWMRGVHGRGARLLPRRFDFLWTVRCHLHFVTGRAEERLTFDLQPEIAQRLGYGSAAAARRRALHEALFPDRQGRRRADPHPVPALEAEQVKSRRGSPGCSIR